MRWTLSRFYAIIILKQKSELGEEKMNHSFKIQGNVSGAIRSDDEMRLIDGNLAEKSFKTQKKILDSFLKGKGFLKYKTNSYIRLNEINVLEYFDLQKERYGSKTLTANFALMPLYVPHDFLSFDLGDRLGILICGKDIWWDYSNETIAALSFSNIIQAIEVFLLPWFNERASVNKLKQELISEEVKRKKFGGRLSNIQQLWVDSLDKSMDYSEIILKNIEVLKLPVGIR